MERRLTLRSWLSAIITLLTWLAGMAVALTTDGSALMEFKNGLTVISPLLQTWKASDASPCSWGGINCAGSGEVQNITLSAQVPRLEGNISASLGRLKSLEGLMLDQNMLSGSIPSELGNLSSLRTLLLSSNILNGGIPPQLGSCSSLVKLWLDGNMLSGDIPESLGNLRNLGSLNVMTNRLTGEIPLSFATLTNLTLFEIGSNLLSGSVAQVIYKNLAMKDYDVSLNNFSGDITTVLDDLSKLPAIELISMEINNFKGTLPPSIGNATTLNYLSLGISEYPRIGTGLGGRIPKEIGKLVNLTTLYLGNNNFTGEIPPEFWNMTSLNNLDLGQTNLRGEIPPEVSNMRLLNTLFLRDNKLNGTIPSSLDKLVNLTILDLSNNSLVGPIPISFTLLTNLKTLAIGYNDLIGSIPANLSKTATSLEVIYLHNNSFSGPVPQDFGRFMPNLTEFAIANNFFNGTMPDGLCKGGKLQWLAVTNNSLQGAIPLSLTSCTSLIHAGFSHNQFTSIPDGFGRGSSLQYLDVSHNQLTGPLPAGLGASSQVALMDLSDNSLTGEISVLEFSNLAQNLSVLKLAKNNFTGEIPASMGMCQLLFQVDLSYNSLTGSVPVALANLSSLQQLHLQDNNLTRLDPSLYSSWYTNLRTLNLANNPWNAPIASEIGSLHILQSLNLSYGTFTGSIPSALEQLTQLEVLDLSHNDLTGEIPSGLGELMVSLVSVDLSFNRLTGPLPPAWVKFLIASPDSFVGNPGLCLTYEANNVCVRGSGQNMASSERKISLSVGSIVGVVCGIAFVTFVALLFYWHRSAKIEGKLKPLPKVEEVLKNLTITPLAFSFEDIMAATENLSDAYIIGRGCHGVVYKATIAKGTHIVVKRIASVDMKTALVHKSFWKEIESTGNARHPNVVRLLGFMQWGDTGFLLYDYVSNGDLCAALHDKERGLDLDWKARLRIAEGVAKGLAYLHHTFSPPIVHRDLTSSNVLLDDDLEPLISDFGLSKVLDISQPRSQQWSSTTPAILGTYGYIAPEVGYSTVVTPKLDVYSYGILLLELLTGKRPADDSSFGESLHVAAWVKDKVRQNGGRMSESVLDPLLDPTVPDLAVKDEMLSVQMMALHCTQDNPMDRPTMKEVVEMFTSLSQRDKNGIKNCGPYLNLEISNWIHQQ